MSYEKNQDGTYVDLQFTKFPAQIDDWENSEDVSSEYLDAINKYKNALTGGNYATAQNILNTYPNLKKMLIGAKDLNQLKHAVMAMERLYTEDIKSLIVDYSNEVKENTDKSTTAASSAMSSKETAEKKAQEVNQLLSDITALKNSLPSSFTEYVDAVNSYHEEAVTKNSADYIKVITDESDKTTFTAGDGSKTTVKKYELPAAAANTLGGVKAGDTVTVATDGTLSVTSKNITNALGFGLIKPVYNIVYDHSYVGTGRSGTSSSPVEVALNDDYDAIAIVKTNKNTYPIGSESARQRMLQQLIIMENSSENFRGNYIPLKVLSNTFKSASSITSGMIVISNTWDNSKAYFKYENRVLSMYFSDSTYPLNSSAYQYHIFGITMDDNILKATTTES